MPGSCPGWPAGVAVSVELSIDQAGLDKQLALVELVERELSVDMPGDPVENVGPVAGGNGPENRLPHVVPNLRALLCGL